jgi:hypothetical protein
MLIRIFLIVAIVAGLACGVLNVVVVKGKITTLTEDRNTQRDQKVAAQNDLATTKKTLTQTQDKLKQTQQDLADAQTARKKAEEVAAAQKKAAEDLNDQLKKATAERDDAQAKLGAYQATGLSAAEVGKLNRQLKDSQDMIAILDDEKRILARTIVRQQNQLNELLGKEEYVVKLRPDLKGKVLVVDPKWDFVVLDIGDNQGVLENGELLISRDGKLVAKVVVRTVQKDRSIANIIPGWKIGDVYEGDMATPAHPAS